MLNKKSKENPEWVREQSGKYFYEYQKYGSCWSHGYYDNALDAHNACIAHQKYIEAWKEPEKTRLKIIDI